MDSPLAGEDTTPTGRTSPWMSRSRQRPRLLVVSADLALTGRLVTSLGEAFAIRVVESVPSALEGLIANELVLVDEEVAGVDGCRTLRAVLGHDASLAIITSKTTTEGAARFFAAGATDLMPRALFGEGFSPPLREAILGRLEVLLHTAAKLRAARGRMLRLSRAQLLARIARWEIDANGGRFAWSEDVTILFGIPTTAPDERVSALLRWVHPDDRLAVACAMLELTPHRLEYRLVLPDGRTVIIHQESELIVDERGATRPSVRSTSSPTSMPRCVSRTERSSGASSIGRSAMPGPNVGRSPCCRSISTASSG
jgi:PAS domain-containing protein